MKKRRFLITVCLLLSVLVVSAGAAAGSASDPLISLSYLEDTFLDKLEKEIDSRLDKSDRKITSGVSDDKEESDWAFAPGWSETRLKAQDMLLGTTGTNVLPLAGGMNVTFSSGAVVDVTTGTEIFSGSPLQPNHRYMVAEDTEARFTVTGKTAVVDYQGSYKFDYSNTTDYNAIAAALKTMNLFKGSFTGFGEGYDLEVAPTRLQALIMFIRVLGEEEAALAYTGTTPFHDIAPGTQAEKYVGYAYEMGYTNGYSATTFRPGQTIPVNQYMEFILRAMGYSSAATSNLGTTMVRAVENGVISEAERVMLQSGTFLRADLVYVSYYALDAYVADSDDTLRDVLLDRGVFTKSDSRKAGELVTSDRLW